MRRYVYIHVVTYSLFDRTGESHLLGVIFDYYHLVLICGCQQFSLVGTASGSTEPLFAAAAPPPVLGRYVYNMGYECRNSVSQIPCYPR